MKKQVKKYKLGEQPNDLAFWLTLTPAERIAALEELRERHVYFFLNGVNPGFQRVYKIIKRA